MFKRKKKFWKTHFFFTIGHYELSKLKPSGIVNMGKKVIITAVLHARERSPIPMKNKKTDRPSVHTTGIPM